MIKFNSKNHEIEYPPSPMDQFDLNLTSFKLSYASQAPSGPARLRWEKKFQIQIIHQRKLVLLVAEIQRIQSGSDSAQFVVVYELLIAIDDTQWFYKLKNLAISYEIKIEIIF